MNKKQPPTPPSPLRGEEKGEGKHQIFLDKSLAGTTFILGRK
jgi:hypothetical protein